MGVGAGPERAAGVALGPCRARAVAGLLLRRPEVRRTARRPLRLQRLPAPAHAARRQRRHCAQRRVPPPRHRCRADRGEVGVAAGRAFERLDHQLLPRVRALLRHARRRPRRVERKRHRTRGRQLARGDERPQQRGAAVIRLVGAEGRRVVGRRGGGEESAERQQRRHWRLATDTDRAAPMAAAPLARLETAADHCTVAN